MTQKQAIQLFEERKVRTVWDDEAGKWYVSIVDVIAVLTESKDAAAYWRKLKQRLKAEGNETVTNCHTLKLKAQDGKYRMTDVTDIEGMFVVEPAVYGDNRGYFMETYNENDFKKAGYDLTFVEVNE